MIPGMQFGRLTTVERVPSVAVNKGYLWRCQCECGSETVVTAGSLTTGNTKSCGCYKRDKAKALFSDPATNPSYKTGNCSGANKRLYQYRSQAARRGYAFELDDDTFFSLFLSACTYCAKSPSFGVDRLDNDLGYTKTNSVPCCKVCNRMKNTHSAEFFITHLQQIINNYRGLR